MTASRSFAALWAIPMWFLIDSRNIFRRSLGEIPIVANERVCAKAGLSFAIGAKNSGPSTRPAAWADEEVIPLDGGADQGRREDLLLWLRSAGKGRCDMWRSSVGLSG
jgi:hypothetical protein